ncbi:MAG: CYTH domain-containing protein [Patescibacteria group bacterium]
MSGQYEIEIKSLLGNPERASNLRKKIKEKGGVFLGGHKQLNHYFVISDIEKFRDMLLPKIAKSKKEIFEKILADGKDFSVRTREADGKVILVVKASIGSDTSANGVSRMEFESEMKMTLNALDKLLLDAGLQYQAKWSREREEYKLGDINICLDKNAGYGYLAEFEKVVTDRTLADTIKKELLGLMEDFAVEELSQDRLERMFTHYNKNWRDYYGTDKIFNIT